MILGVQVVLWLLVGLVVSAVFEFIAGFIGEAATDPDPMLWCLSIAFWPVLLAAGGVALVATYAAPFCGLVFDGVKRLTVSTARGTLGRLFGGAFSLGRRARERRGL